MAHSVKRTEHMTSIKLTELTNPGKFAQALHDGWITGSQNPEHPDHTVYTYTNATQYAANWQPDTTMIARGLVIKLTANGTDLYNTIHGDWKHTPVETITSMFDNATVIARGMRKFFAVETNAQHQLSLVDDDEQVTINQQPNLDFTAPASISDKLDGALGVTIIIGNQISLCTKGAFHSDEADAGTEYLHTKHDADGFRRFLETELGEWTPLFEIIKPGAFHVVQYHDLADIILLGLVNKRTGWWVPAALFDSDPKTKDTRAKEIPERFNFRTPTVYAADTLEQALAMPDLPNHEGMVCTLDLPDGQELYKIKYPRFLLLDRFKNRMSPTAMREAIKLMPAEQVLSGGMPDFAAALPADLRDAAQPIISRLDEDAERLYLQELRRKATWALDLYPQAKTGLDLESRDGAKEYARRVHLLDAPRDVRSILFALKKATPGGEREAAVNAARKIIVK